MFFHQKNEKINVKKQGTKHYPTTNNDDTIVIIGVKKCYFPHKQIIKLYLYCKIILQHKLHILPLNLFAILLHVLPLSFSLHRSLIHKGKKENINFIF